MYPHRDFPLIDSLQKLVPQVPLHAHNFGIWNSTDSSTAALALWAILNFELKLGLAAIESLVGDTSELSNQVRELLRNYSSSDPVVMLENQLYFENTDEPVPPIATSMKPFLDSLIFQAVNESVSSGVNYVGSEHLLLAIISTADTKLSSVLSRHELTHEAVARTIGDLLAL